MPKPNEPKPARPYVIVDVQSGQYLEHYDPDVVPADPTDPRTGLAEWTRDVGRAMKFATNAAALRCWQATSTVRPLRPDGKPNRPLSAFTVLIEQVGA
jgi:hypothetical protein